MTAFGHAALAAAVVAAALAYEPSASAVAVKSTLLAAVALVAMGWAFVRVREQWPRRAGVPRGAFWWVAWFGWMLISSAWATRPVPVVAVAWAATGGLALYSGTLDPDSGRRLARTCASWLVAGSAIACAVQLGLGAPAIGQHGLHGNPNWLGLVVACALPLTLEQAWLDVRPGTQPQSARARRMGLVRAISLLSGGALALVCARSRVAWVALAVTAVLWLVARGGSAPTHRSRWRIAAGFAAAATVALAWWLTAGDGAASWAGRIWIWTTSGAVAVANLPLGVGLGGWHAAFVAEQGHRLSLGSPTEAASLFVNATTAHNDWLESLTAGGPVALGLLAMAMLVAFTTLWKTWRAGAASVAVVAIAALGDSPLHQPAALAVLGLVLGCTPEMRPGRWLGLIHGVLWAASILLLPWALRAWLGQRALQEAETLAPQARITHLETACELDPHSSAAALRLGVAHLEMGRASEALAPLTRSLELQLAVGTEVALGNARVRLGRSADAVEAYDAAIALHPGSFRARLNRTEALRLAGRLAEAENELAIARTLQPGHPKLALIAHHLRRARIDAAAGTPRDSAGPDPVNSDAGSREREAGGGR